MVVEAPARRDAQRGSHRNGWREPTAGVRAALSSRVGTTTAWLGLVAFSALLGVVAVGRAPGVSHLPLALIVAVVAILALIPIAVGRWRGVLGLLLVWLALEDLFRKLAGNDLRIYAVKDLLAGVLFLAMFIDPDVRGTWREASGRTRYWLYAVIAWAVLLSLPAWIEDWRSPLVALRLDFLYVPLVAAGYFVVASGELDKWLRRLVVLGAATGAAGVAQAVIGPGFLSPTRAVRGLPLLDLVRGLPGAAAVYRPTGTFVDAGRFTAAVVVALSITLCAAVYARPRLSTRVALVITSAAIWVSGGRTGFLVASVLVLTAAIAPSWAYRRGTFGRTLRLALGGAAALVLLAVLVPDIFTSRLAWYRDTLTPGSSQNEWSFRQKAYTDATFRGLRLGGPLGRGTGRESLGRQYLYGGADRSTANQYDVEGGYAGVAVEWGWIGLSLWLLWTGAWLRRGWRAAKGARGTPHAAVGLILIVWMVYFLVVGFFTGLQSFQNYIANAYFWLVSGVLFALPGRTTGAGAASQPAERSTNAR